MISIRKLLGVLCLVCCSLVGNTQTVTHQISDDGYANVPLQFGFPYYGQTFTDSWMFSNGIISFQNPEQSGLAWQNLSVQPFSQQMGSAFNYSIYPLWTDLINLRGSFTTQGTQEYQRYNWIGISPYADSSRINTFSVELKPTGEIATTYSAVSVNYGFTGQTGNTILGEYTQEVASWSPISSLSNWQSFGEAVDVCSTNPLASVSCPGYAQAYLQEQCSVSPLYSTECSGYAQAYLQEQCTANPLYSTQCPGYGAAFALRMLSTQPDTVTSLPEPEQQTQSEPEQQPEAQQQQSTVSELTISTGSANSARPQGRSVVNARAVAQAAALAATQLAEAVASDSVAGSEQVLQQSVSLSAVSLQTPEATQESKLSQDLATQAETFAQLAESQEPKSQQSVKPNRTASLSGGPDPLALAVQPLGFGDYLVQQLQDVQFYTITEAYKNQRTVDNQRLLRGLTGGSDMRHQQLVDAQYNQGVLNVTKP
jgi:hypothetical protein